MLSLVTVSPVITAFHSCCLSHHVFAQVNLWPAWVGIETAIFWQCSPGTVETQRFYPLRCGPRRAIKVGFFGYINLLICSPYLVFHSRVRTEFVIVFFCGGGGESFLRWGFLIWENWFLFIADFLYSSKEKIILNAKRLVSSPDTIYILITVVKMTIQRPGLHFIFFSSRTPSLEVSFSFSISLIKFRSVFQSNVTGVQVFFQHLLTNDALLVWTTPLCKSLLMHLHKKLKYKGSKPAPSQDSYYKWSLTRKTWCSELFSRPTRGSRRTLYRFQSVLSDTSGDLYWTIIYFKTKNTTPSKREKKVIPTTKSWFAQPNFPKNSFLHKEMVR